MSDLVNEHPSTITPDKPEPVQHRRIRIRDILMAIGIIVVLISLLLPATRSAARPAARRAQCMNNLKQIAFALSKYQDTFGSLPPAYIAENDGTPLHSWRVLILPFLDQNELYAQYRFDEPWNGPNNQKLAKRMPSVYRCPSVNDNRWNWATSEVPAGITQYTVITGDQTPFPGQRAMKTSEIQDATSNTIAVVELDANSGVPWLEPRDINPAGFSRMLSIENKSRMQHPGGINTAFIDGAVRFLKQSIDRQTLYDLTTANGGEKIDSEAY